MVKADMPWPRPQHVAWQSPYLNCFRTRGEPSLLGLPAYLNSSSCIFPAVGAFPGLTAPAIPSLKTELTDGVQGFIQYPNAEPSLKETHTGGALQNANPAPLQQKKLVIVDHSGNKTRLFYGPDIPLVHRPIATTSKLAQAYHLDQDGQASHMGQKFQANYRRPEEPDKDHIVHEEGEMHEDTEEINALLYSDDDDEEDDDNCDEVTSICRSPSATKRTYQMQVQEQCEDTKEEVASSDWPNKRLKIIDGGYNRSSPHVESISSMRPNESFDFVSDAESKNCSGGAFSTEKTKVDKSMVGNIKLKKDKIRQSLKVLENLIPGLKGKEPMTVIDGTIEYLESLMKQTGTVGGKYH